jgi:hypothetical protein
MAIRRAAPALRSGHFVRVQRGVVVVRSAARHRFVQGFHRRLDLIHHRSLPAVQDVYDSNCRDAATATRL